MSQFQEDLKSLINSHSQETASGTPDYILAEYLMNCLASYNQALQARERWYGRSVNGKSIRSESIPIPNSVQEAIQENLEKGR